MLSQVALRQGAGQYSCCLHVIARGQEGRLQTGDATICFGLLKRWLLLTRFQGASEQGCFVFGMLAAHTVC